MFDKVQLAAVVRAIPGPTEVPASIADLAKRLDSDTAEARGSVQAVVALLSLFGAVEFSETENERQAVRAAQGSAKYFLLSVAQYLEEEREILSNWERPIGHTRALFPEHVASGPQFLRAIELRRFGRSPESKAVRQVKMVRVVIKAKVGWLWEPRYLVQFDSETGRYKLIGGQVRSSDPDELTALRREVDEELREQPLAIRSDYHVRELKSKTFVVRPSSSNGAITNYEISHYQLFLHVPVLKLGPVDRWVTLKELKTERTSDRQPIDTHGLKELEESHSGGLERLPLSIHRRQNYSIREYFKFKGNDVLMVALAVLGILATIVLSVLQYFL